MKKALFFVVIFAAFGVFGQKKEELRRKYLGLYEGVIPAYKMDTGADVVDVSETLISIEIDSDSLHILIGSHELKGSYEVMFKADDYYLLDARMEGQLAAERIMVYQRGKRISRDGLFPQPIAELQKK